MPKSQITKKTKHSALTRMIQKVRKMLVTQNQSSTGIFQILTNILHSNGLILNVSIDTCDTINGELPKFDKTNNYKILCKKLLPHISQNLSALKEICLDVNL